MGGGGGARSQGLDVCVGHLGKKKNDRMIHSFQRKLKIVLILNVKLRSKHNDNTFQYKTSKFLFLTTQNTVSYSEY